MAEPTAKPRTRRSSPPSAWADAFRRRVRLARMQRGQSFAEAGRYLGKSGMYAVSKIESGGRRRLTIVEVVGLCHALRVSLRDLLEGWDGWLEGAAPPDVASRPDAPTRTDAHTRRHVRQQAAQLDVNCRRNMRQLRGEQGSPVVAKAIDVPQSSIVRWESGQYEHLDLAQLERLATYFRVSLTSLFGADVPVPVPLESPADDRPQDERSDAAG